MGTVYDFGRYSITKDLIFGWAIIIDGTVMLLSEVPSSILVAASSVNYPVYVPEDFQIAVRAEVTRREAQAASEVQAAAAAKLRQEENAKKAKAAADQLRPFSDFPHVPRHEDRSKLMSEIISKTIPCTEHGGITAACLGYVRVDNLGSGELPWRAVNTNGTTPWVQQFATVDEMIDRILARYW